MAISALPSSGPHPVIASSVASREEVGILGESVRDRLVSPLRWPSSSTPIPIYSFFAKSAVLMGLFIGERTIIGVAEDVDITEHHHSR